MTLENSQRKREAILSERFSEEFAQLQRHWRSIIDATPPDLLYKVPPSANGIPLFSVGENVLRSAATVEQTFGGITANLWDDPFEWTLPETLSTPSRIIEYLDEVETTCKCGFASLDSDADLQRDVVLPSGESQRLSSLLMDTLARAFHYQGQALAALKVLYEQ